MSFFATQEYKQKGLEVIKSHFDYIRSYTKDLFTLFEEKVVLAQGRAYFYGYGQLLPAGMRCEVRIASGFGIHAY